MEEKDDGFNPSIQARNWSIAFSLTNATLAFSLIAAPAVSPLLAAATIFTGIKSTNMFVKEYMENKRVRNIQRKL